MVLLHRQATDHDDPNDPFHILHPDREATSVDSILPCSLPQHKFRLESILVPPMLVVQEPCAGMPAQDRSTLACDPRIIVSGRATSGRAMEEQLGVRGKRDVHYGGLGRCALQARAEARAEFPGRVRSEVRKDAALLLCGDLLELPEVEIGYAETEGVTQSM